MNIFQSLLMYAVWFLSTYFVILFMILVLKYRKTIFERKTPISNMKLPKVSIVISAYNEEKAIKETILSLKNIEYPKEKLEIIIINDGSKDRTASRIEYLKKEIGFVFINNAKNKGKAACLNQGIKKAKGEFVVCMDADTRAKYDVIKKSLEHFDSDDVAAVTVGIDVKPKNLLQRITQIEYLIGLSLSLAILSRLDTVHVTPGPFTIFRRSILNKIGGFDAGNMTEDMEIAYRLQKSGYKIKCCLSTKVYTEVPRNLKALYRQRKRWYTGALQTVVKHKDVLFNTELGVFGFFIPYNFSLILLGVTLFVFSLVVSILNSIKNLSFYRLTGFNFLSHLELNLDPLSIFNIYSLLILFSFIMTFIMAFLGLRILKKSVKKSFTGFIGFLYLFILYQVFWISSIYAFVFRRRVQWR
jgi:cellulose synthase/poly-beta-1,6-N-acetylglucosamine synthase-like glycosyltransferase